MKKFIILCLAFCLCVVSLTSCSKKKAEKYCFNCGSAVLSSDSFCASCGADIADHSATTATETTATTTTAEKTTTATTVKTKATTTTRAVKKTTTTTITTTTTTTTTTATPKTTRTLTQEELETIYNYVYYENMSLLAEYREYLNIDGLKSEIDDLRAQASDLYTQYLSKKKQLEEQCAANGLLNSGYYESTLRGLENQYNKDRDAILEEQRALQDELEQNEALYADAESEIDDIIMEEYLAAVEEFQQKTLS